MTRCGSMDSFADLNSPSRLYFRSAPRFEKYDGELNESPLSEIESEVRNFTNGDTANLTVKHNRAEFLLS